MPEPAAAGMFSRETAGASSAGLLCPGARLELPAARSLCPEGASASAGRQGPSWPEVRVQPSVRGQLSGVLAGREFSGEEAVRSSEDTGGGILAR